MLSEAMYRGLRAGVLPKVYPLKGYLELGEGRLRQARFSAHELKNSLNLVRPLRVIKSVDIEKTEFSGYRFRSSSAYIVKYGDELSYRVHYKSLRATPVTGKVTQRMGPRKDVIIVIFMPYASWSFESKYQISDPQYLECSSEVLALAGVFRYDRVTETFPVGLLDDRYKPVGEFPVSGADNVVLETAYDWRVQNTVYPTPLPPGLSFDSMSVSMVSGFYPYEGKHYKDPATENRIRASARVVNGTGATIRVTNWGAPLSVLGEDNRHVAQINCDISFPARDIPNGGAYSYSVDLNLPTWCFGRVALAHAMNVYRAGMYVYGGGPLWQFEVFRLRLP
jgi:hypothetical protein